MSFCSTVTKGSATVLRDAATTPDGRHLYAGAGSDLLATFARDPSSGALSPLESVFDVSSRLLTSPDGRHVYATGFFLLATYTRDESSGALTRTDLENGVVGPAPIHQAEGLAISPDGHHLYLGSFGSPIPKAPGRRGACSHVTRRAERSSSSRPSSRAKTGSMASRPRPTSR